MPDIHDLSETDIKGCMIAAWQYAAIEDGTKAADSGRVVAHDEVAAWVQSWGRLDELPMPKCG